MNRFRPSLLVFSILDTPAVGGAEENLLSIYSFLVKRGHRVILATNNQQVAVRAEAVGVETVRFPFRLDMIGNWKGLIKFGLFSFPAVWWLLKTLSSIKADAKRSKKQLICFQPGFSDRLLFSPFIVWLKVPLVWLEHGPLEPTFKRNLGIPKLWYSLVNKTPAKVVAISEFTARSLIEMGKINESQISIIYPVVRSYSSRYISEARKTANQWLQRHQLYRRNLVVTVGRVETEKEFEILIKSLKYLPTKTADSIHVLIIGSGSLLPLLRQQLRMLNLESHCTLTGYLPEKLKVGLIAQAKIFVFPSAWPLEGFGLTTAEALGLGCPIITTGAGPQAEIVINGETGLYFKPHNSRDLARQIQKYLTHPRLASKYARAGQRMIKHRFAPSSTTIALEKVLIKLTS